MGFLQKALLVAIAAAFFFANVSAGTIGVPSEVTVFGEAADFSFTVQNGENVERTATIEFFAPTNFIFLEKPSTIGPLESKEATIRIFPQKNLEGTTFTALLVTEIGTTRTEKTIIISFKKEISCPVEINTSISEVEKSGVQEIIILSEAQNKKNSAVQFSILSFNGLPESWVVDMENSTLLNELETRIIRTRIVPNSSFSGIATIVYSCGNFVEIRPVSIEHKHPNPIAVGLAGLFSQEGIFGGAFLEGINALNIFLIIVAAVLLVMFISRLVKVVGVEKNSPRQNQFKAKTTDSAMPPSGVQMQALRKESKLEELKKIISGEK